MSFPPSTWRKSSRSSDAENSDCVEVGFFGSGVGVRDSKNPNATPLTFDLPAWLAALKAVQH